MAKAALLAGLVVRRCSVAVCLLPVLGHAASKDVVETVVVTATRIETPLQTVPASIDAVDGGALREQQLRVNLSEALGRVPGLIIQNRYNYSQDLQVSSRGFGARASFGVRGVRLIQDGIPLTMPDGQGQTGMFDLDRAARVEVLRGPFAALYGNSAGGVIQLVTSEGRNPPAVTLSASDGAFGSHRVALQAGGGVGSLRLSGDVARFQTDGPKDHSAARRDNANAKAVYEFDDGGRLTVTVNRLEQPDTQDPLGLTTAQLAADPRQAGTGALQFNTRKRIAHQQEGVTYERKVSANDDLKVFGYTGTRALTQYLANGSASLVGSGGVVDLDRVFGGGGAQWHHAAVFGETAVGTTIGVAYDRLREHRLGYVNVNGIEGALRRNELDLVASFDQYALVEVQPTLRLKFSAAVRHSVVLLDSADRFVVGPNPDDSGKTHYTSTQPVLGANFAVTQGVSLYASAGKGFETPTFTELAYRPDGNVGLNFGLKAAETRNVESGIKAQWGSFGHATAAVFHAETSNDIVSGPSPFQGRTTYVNARLTRRQGAELSWSDRIFDQFDLAATYTLTDARFVDFTNFTGVDLDGARVPGVPKNLLFVSGTWRAPRFGFVAGADVSHAGRVYADDANSAVARAYSLVGLHAGFAQKLTDWTLNEFVRIDNAFDANYAGSVIVNAANARYFESSPGRAFYAGFDVTYAFR